MVKSELTLKILKEYKYRYLIIKNGNVLFFNNKKDFINFAIEDLSLYNCSLNSIYYGLTVENVYYDLALSKKMILKELRRHNNSIKKWFEYNGINY